MEGYCDSHAAAEYLGIKYRGIEVRVKKGEIPYYKMGKLIRFKYADLDAWMAGFRVKTHQELMAEAQEALERR